MKKPWSLNAKHESGSIAWNLLTPASDARPDKLLVEFFPDQSFWRGREGTKSSVFRAIAPSSGGERNSIPLQRACLNQEIMDQTESASKYSYDREWLTISAISLVFWFHSFEMNLNYSLIFMHTDISENKNCFLQYNVFIQRNSYTHFWTLYTLDSRVN